MKHHAFPETDDELLRVLAAIAFEPACDEYPEISQLLDDEPSLAPAASGSAVRSALVTTRVTGAPPER